MAACATVPPAAELSAGSAVLPVTGPSRQVADGRAAFRQAFCVLAREGGHTAPDDAGCDRLLWRLSDEPPGTGQVPAASHQPVDPRLRLVMVTGAFSDCLGPDARPFNDAVAPLLSRGYRIDTVVVSGRSSATHNARQLAEAVERLELSAEERLVLLGYSKGAVDILHFLVEYPGLAARVAAVVSVSGPIFGTPAASAGRWAYDSLLAGTFAGHCDPGDGGVLDSMLPEVRRQWLAEHPLPTGVRYFSLAAFTTKEHLARGLRASWQLLARREPRNDGQVTIADAVIPGSILLGYANADHWGVAIRVENELPFLAKRPSARSFPHEPLLEAILRVVDAAQGG